MGGGVIAAAPNVVTVVALLLTTVLRLITVRAVAEGARIRVAWARNCALMRLCP